MKPRFSLYRRNGIYYAQDTHNGKQESLRTRDEAAAKALIHSKNEAFRQPILNQQIALAYRITPKGVRAESLVFSFVNSLTCLTAEMEGRHYGGGVLELAGQIAEELDGIVERVSELLDAGWRWKMDDGGWRGSVAAAESVSAQDVESDGADAIDEA